MGTGGKGGRTEMAGWNRKGAKGLQWGGRWCVPDITATAVRTKLPVTPLGSNP